MSQGIELAKEYPPNHSTIKLKSNKISCEQPLGVLPFSVMCGYTEWVVTSSSEK